VAGGEKLLALNPRPTAIFASNDEMAAGVYRTANRLGLAIPGDLSIVGFDDGPLASRLLPSLTTIRLPIRELGRLAANKLLHPEAPGGIPDLLAKGDAHVAAPSPFASKSAMSPFFMTPVSSPPFDPVESPSPFIP